MGARARRALRRPGRGCPRRGGAGCGVGKAQRLSNHRFLDLAGALSPGAVQQAVLNAKPGYYVEACFMDTQDHREHTQLGMLRLIRIVK